MKGDQMNEDLEPRQLAPAQLEEMSGAKTTGTDHLIDDEAPAKQVSTEDLQAVFDVPVKVQAVLGRAKMDIGELLRLKPGMVVELDRRVGEPVDIFVNNRLIARGEVVLIESELGVTLTEIVRQER